MPRRRAVYADAAFRARVKRQADGRGPDDDVFMGKELEGDTRRAAFWTYVITKARDPALKERKLADVAKERGKHAVDLMLDLALEDLDTRMRASQLNFVEDEVREIIKDPNVVIGLGDGGAHLSQLCDACYSTHLLGHWVREDGALSLEQAVHRLTGATGGPFRPQRSRPPGRRSAGRHRGVRSGDGGRFGARTRQRPAGRRRPPDRPSARYPGRRRERPAAAAAGAGSRQAQRTVVTPAPGA